MKFKFWNDLSDEQKEKLLKKICGITALVFIIVILLLIMKCENYVKKVEDAKKAYINLYG